MPENPDLQLSRRERQIMSVLFREGEASVADVAAGIPSAPSRTAIRTLLRILETKGYVRRRRDGRRHLYRPAVSRGRAARAALSHVLDTFFGGSLSDAVAARLADPSAQPDRDELERLLRLVDEAREGSAEDESAPQEPADPESGGGER
ncbi:MAG TPA: BlaI/MecI/CopY family transcriptional regulator [Thermoanaerobaculia bacterium]|nr:BlaI/MecI/CopY family transcriptional regulator [Thermoanaerobaculia bacterium]